MTMFEAVNTVLRDSRSRYPRNLVFRRDAWHHQDALYLTGSDREIVSFDDAEIALTLTAEDVLARDWVVMTVLALRSLATSTTTSVA